MFCIVLLFPNSLLYGEQETTDINYFRLALTTAGGLAAGGYALKESMEIWGTKRGPFHFKDDWDGDNLIQVDEVSHMVIAYKMAQAGRYILEWDGFSHKWANIMGAGVSFLWLFVVEYPIDSYNPYQGFGVSDLLFDIAGCAFAYFRANHRFLQKFDLRFSTKVNPFQLDRIIAWTTDEYDSWVYWLTYTPVPQRIPFSISIGYSSWREHTYEPKREWHIGFTVSLYELYSFIRKTEYERDFWGLYQVPINEHILREK